MVRLAIGSSSEGFWVRGLEGRNTSIEKGIIGEGGNITRVDGQLPGNVQAISDVSEQVMNVFDPCEKSHGQLILEVSNEQRGPISHGPKGPASHGPKDSSSQGSPSTQASLDKDEKETVKAGMIFQAKAKENGKQILGKGSLKKNCLCEREEK